MIFGLHYNFFQCDCTCQVRAKFSNTTSMGKHEILIKCLVVSHSSYIFLSLFIMIMYIRGCEMIIRVQCILNVARRIIRKAWLIFMTYSIVLQCNDSFQCASSYKSRLSHHENQSGFPNFSTCNVEKKKQQRGLDTRGYIVCSIAKLCHMFFIQTPP